MNEKKKIVFWNVSGQILPTLDGQTTKRQRTLRETLQGSGYSFRTTTRSAVPVYTV